MTKDELKKQIADLTKKLESPDVVEEEVFEVEPEQTPDEVLSDEEELQNVINPEDIVSMITVGTDKNGQLFFKINGSDNIVILDGLVKYANLFVQRRWKNIEDEINRG